MYIRSCFNIRIFLHIMVCYFLIFLISAQFEFQPAWVERRAPRLSLWCVLVSPKCVLDIFQQHTNNGFIIFSCLMKIAVGNEIYSNDTTALAKLKLWHICFWEYFWLNLKALTIFAYCIWCSVACPLTAGCYTSSSYYSTTWCIFKQVWNEIQVFIF